MTIGTINFIKQVAFHPPNLNYSGSDSSKTGPNREVRWRTHHIIDLTRSILSSKVIGVIAPNDVPSKYPEEVSSAHSDLISPTNVESAVNFSGESMIFFSF